MILPRICLALFLGAQEEDPFPRPFVILETREVRDLLAEGKRHLEARRPAPALAAFQRILDEVPNHLVAAEGSHTRFVGAGRAVDERIASLEEAEREAYEAAFGPKAAAMLRSALGWNDPAKIREVASRFGNTLAGIAARTILGDLAFERGDFETARREYARALDRAGLDRRPHLLARLALTLARLGDEPGLEALREAAGSFDVAAVEIAGQPVELREVLERASAEAAARRSPGTLSRGVPFGRELSTRPQWTFRLPMDPFEPPFHVREILSYLPPNLLPVVEEGVVLLSDSLRLYALDLLNGRNALWAYRGAPEWEEVAAKGRDEVSDFFLALRASTLVQPAASAGVAVDALQVPLRRPSDSIDTFQGIHIRTILPERRLFAFDLRTGAPLWSHWSPTASKLGVGPFENQATVAAPPVADRERVYAVSVLYQGKVDLYVCAYELRTGRPVWRTRLIFGQVEANMFGRPFLEFSGSPPLLEDGSLFLSTNLGAVARLEAETGRVEWLSLYDPIPIPKPRFHELRQRAVPWANGPPVLGGLEARPDSGGGLLYVAPLDSKDLLVLDPENGATLAVVTDRQILEAIGEISPRHLAGAIDDLVLLAGAKAAAFRCEREEGGRVRADLAWEELGTDAEGLGPLPRPALVGERLFLPAADGPVAVDALTGKRLQAELYWGQRHEHRGNLFAADGALLSVSMVSLNAFFDWEGLLHAARERGGGGAEAARLLLRRGEARLAEGNATAALVDLREADRILSGIEDAEAAPGTHFQLLLSLARAEREARASPGAVGATLRRAVERAPDPRGRLEALLALERALADVPGSREEIGEIEDVLLREFADVVADVPGRGRVPVGLHVLLRRSDALEAAGDRSGAVSALRAAATRFGSVRTEEGTVVEVASLRIRALVAGAPESLRRAFEAESLASLEDAARDPAALARLAREYPGTAGEIEARILLGEISVERGDVETAWNSLRNAVLCGEPSRAARAWRRIAFLGDEIGNLPLARAALARAARVGAETASDWPADAGASYASLRRPPPEPLEPAPGPPRDPTRMPGIVFAGGEVRVLDPLGEEADAADLLFVFGYSDLSLYRPGEKGLGASEWTRSFRTGRDHAVLDARVVVVSSGRATIVVDGRLHLLDLATGEDAVSPRALPGAQQGGRDVLYGDGVVLVRGFDARDGTTWSAFDAAAALPLWSVALGVPYPDPPRIADGEAIWIPASTSADQPIRRHDLLSGELRSTMRLPNLLAQVDGSRAIAAAGLLLLPVRDATTKASVALAALSLRDGAIHNLLPPSDATTLRNLVPHPIGPLAVFGPREGAPRGLMGQVARVALDPRPDTRPRLVPLFTLPTGSFLAGMGSTDPTEAPPSHALLVVPEASGQIRLALHDLATGEALWRRGTTRAPYGMGNDSGGRAPPLFVGRDVVALLEEGSDGIPTVAVLSKEDGAPGNRFPLGTERDRPSHVAELRAFGTRLLVVSEGRIDLFGERTGERR